MKNHFHLDAGIDDSQHVSLVARGGGVDDLSCWSLGGPALRLLAIGALLAGLTTLVAVPHSVVAQSQPTCSGGVTYATPVTTITGTKTAVVECKNLAQGLTLNIEPGATIGLESARVVPSGEPIAALNVRASYGYQGTGGSGNNDIVVTNRGSIWSSKGGIWVVQSGSGDMRVDHLAGTIDAGKRGIIAEGKALTGNMTLKTAVGSRIKASEHGIDAFFDNFVNVRTNAVTASTGDLTVTHNGQIEAKHMGIRAVNEGEGNVMVSTGAQSSIVAEGTGVNFVGVPARGGIVAFVRTGDPNGVSSGRRTGSTAGTVTIDHKGTISSKAEGIHASNRVAGNASAITITTGVDPAPNTPSITAGRQGIQLRHEGNGTFAITIRGTVMGDNAYISTNTAKYAGVHIEVKAGDTSRGGGGTIVVGSQAHVSSKSGVAIKVDDYAGHVEVILEQGSDGYVGHVEGEILSANAAATGTLTLYTRRDGTKTQLDPGDTVLRFKTMGVYTEEVKAELKTITGGFKFEDVMAGTAATPGASSSRRYQNRARLYEVLPVLLAGLMEPVPYGVRMGVPRRTTGETIMVGGSKGESMAVASSGTGVWVRLEAREGKRRAATSTTTTGKLGRLLSWDVDRTSVTAGVDMPTDNEDLMVGLSAHYQQSEATVGAGGRVEATGMGLGLSLTWTGEDGLYVDGQLSYSWFSDIEMVSGTNGVITSGGEGTGMAAAVEVGRRIPVGTMIVTPRGGLSWSSVDMDAFAEPATIKGHGRVAPSPAESVQGRVGVSVEMDPKDANARLYGSLDLEHEFDPEFEVMAAGTRLTAKVKPTWVRAGVGGSVPLGDTDTMLAGDVFYATAGSGNTDFGGGLSVTIRF